MFIQNPMIGTDPLGLDYVDGPLGMADRVAGIPSGGLSSTANMAVGAGGGFQAPFGFGMGADSSIVVDFKLNSCWHSDICHARGFGLSGPITHIFNYMRKELIVRKIYNNEYGMLFMIIGLLMAIAGGVLAFLWLPRGGAFIVIIGWIIGAAGLVVHFATNANDIFGGK